MIIFVVGNSRSGTTLMARMLGRHPAVFTFGELHFFGNMWDPDSSSVNIGKQEAIHLLSGLLARQREGFLRAGNPSKYQSEAYEILAKQPETTFHPMEVYRLFLQNETEKHQKSIPCEHTPSNNYFTKLLLEQFSDAYFIHMIRDPRDVMLSQKKKWKRKFLGAHGIPLSESIRSYCNYHPLLISLIWKKNIMLSRYFMHEPRYRIVFFERLLADAEKELTDICLFLNLPFHPDMLQVPQWGSSSRMDRNAVMGVDASMAGQWKKGGLNQTEIWWCEKINRPLMQSLNYTPSGASPQPFRLVWYILLLPVKTLLSFLLNLHRMKNIRSTITRKLAG